MSRDIPVAPPSMNLLGSKKPRNPKPAESTPREIRNMSARNLLNEMILFRWYLAFLYQEMVWCSPTTVFFTRNSAWLILYERADRILAIWLKPVNHYFASTCQLIYMLTTVQ